MNKQLGFERCLTFINCQLQPAAGKPGSGAGRRAVTLSRQTGSGGHAVAERLAEYLQAAFPKDTCPWTVFDRNLVEKVLEHHHLPQRLARFMAEDRTSEIADTMDELFGLHPPSWTLVRQTADTILHLAQLGNVIIIGRGANIITGRLAHVFHVRLVASLEKRIEQVQQMDKLGPKAARQFIEREDRGRRRYLRKYFGKDPDDPLLYHVIINTDLVSYEHAARMIGNAMLSQGP
jgi:cytidylate kinase